jgi:hypothetical protein
MSVTIHASPQSNRMRVPSASIRPFAALSFAVPWQLAARIEMKTMLSMPRTISSSVSVMRLIQPPFGKKAQINRR